MTSKTLLCIVLKYVYILSFYFIVSLFMFLRNPVKILRQNSQPDRKRRYGNDGLFMEEKVQMRSSRIGKTWLHGKNMALSPLAGQALHPPNVDVWLHETSLTLHTASELEISPFKFHFFCFTFLLSAVWICNNSSFSSLFLHILKITILESNR